MPKKVFSQTLTVQGRKIGLKYPTYFIADIAANHDGSLAKAKDLITLAKKAGADAAKFQHFRAEKIVSQYGFDTMRSKLSHQSKWKKSVFEVYQEASVPWQWTPELKRHADKVGIHFFSAPYDLEAIDMLDRFMPAYKIGSGDITWHDALKRIASKKKPVFLACGASDMKETEEAVRMLSRINPQLCLMQCNTNYTGSKDNFNYLNLNVLKTFAKRFPGLILGLSDHTPGHSAVLGAVTLGARAIEKHFTSSRNNVGPDHPFSMEPADWREMVDRTRELEAALGDGVKRVEKNEAQTVFIQRRCVRAARDLKAGQKVGPEDVEVLRPVKPGSFTAAETVKPLGKRMRRSIPKGEALKPELLN